MLGRLMRTLFWLFLLAVGAGIAYSFTDAFGARWRDFVIDALADRGVFVDFKRFGLHPLDGLVAEDIRVFKDASREHTLLYVDRLSLDIDQGRILEKKIYINGIDVHRATVSLPLDPDNDEASRLEIKNLSARVLLDSQHVDIVKAEGDMEGFHLALDGNIKLPPKKPAKDSDGKDKKTATPAQRMATIQAKRPQIEKVFSYLKRFSFSKTPVIRVHVVADAMQMEHASGSVQFDADGAAYAGYTASGISAKLEYQDGHVQLKHLSLKDSLGALDASGSWQREAEAVEFCVQTSADLPGLAKAVLNSDALHEVVFYEKTPPEVNLEGRYFVQGPKSKLTLPVELTGTVQCGRFNTRGEVFDGISGVFGVTPEGFYIREGLLRHATGTFAFQVMNHSDSGLKYQAALKMEPRAFLPFITRKEQRELIERFHFNERSSIFVLMDGYALDGAPRSLVHSGKAELRDFVYRDTSFVSARGNLEIAGRVQVLKDVELVREDGRGTAEQVVIDNNFGQVILTGAKAILDPVPLVRCFAPPIAKNISKYQFSSDTMSEVKGIIPMRKTSVSDFAVTFSSPKGHAMYELWGKNYKIARPTGTITFKEGRLGYNVSGSVFGGDMNATGDVEISTGKSGYNVKFRAERFPFEVIGKDVPFENVKADVTSSDNEAPFDVTADLLGGRFSLKGRLDLTDKPHPYQGELRAEAVSFQRFAQIYSPTHESEGDLTGHFKFSGRLEDWKALKGNGVMIILNGNLYAVPILGPLTPLLGTILPSPIRGYNVAKEANCTFRVADGFVVTEDVEALTSTFKIVSSGAIDFLKDDIDFTAQVRVRGLPGFVLRPVSQLLEYKAEGSVGNPTWKPHLFGLTGDSEGRQRPTEAQLDAAAKEGDRSMQKDGQKPGESTPPKESDRRPIFKFFNRPGK